MSDAEQKLIGSPGSPGASPAAAAAGKDKDPEPRLCRVGKDLRDYIHSCHAQKQKPDLFCDNEVTTSKYTLNPFSRHFLFFKNIAEQFQRAANCYFLLISVLQLIPGVSPTGRFTTIGPLMLVVMVSLFKDAYEDWQRHKQDAMLNSSPATVYRAAPDGGPLQFMRVKWRDVMVGDIMRVTKGDDFPADLVILWTTEPMGLCYIETSQLDGETNLKIRKACSVTAERPDFVKQLESFTCRINYEQPNAHLYKFEGNIVIDGATTPLNNDNIFLRGSQLRNTEYAYGAVVYTGQETKLMKNATGKRHKMSNLDRLTNKMVLYVFIFQIIIAIFSMCALAVATTNLKPAFYLAMGDVNVAATVFLGFMTFLILFNNMIPISLYVSMEMCKIIQAVLMNNDIGMYYEATDTPALARTSALNEDLGQIRYVLSDKTGTLTCNTMDFMKFTTTNADGTCAQYGSGITEIARAAATRAGKVLNDSRPPGFKGKDGFCFYDPKVTDSQGLPVWDKQPNRAQIEEFVHHLAVCHTVISEVDKIDPTGPKVYQAASPDEGCLVKGARELGVVFDARTETACTVIQRGKTLTYQVLDIIEFDSTRKRMSVIVRNPDGRLQLLIKGADNVIYDRLRKTKENEQLLAQTLEHLTTFAAEGLRTLVLAKAELNETEYKAWAVRYQEAGCAVKDRDKLMAALGEEIEKDLVLVGTTAIEDKLQEGVPATIELCINAGIKVWVLTGDKQETAINIGYACALLHNHMLLWEFDDCNTAKEVVDKMLESKEKANDNVAKGDQSKDMGLVIQGPTLHHLLGDAVEKSISLQFLSLATGCKSVICCRVSPAQKAQVVTLVRENVDDAITLAIGDGANDVPMIQSADVGVGIAGVEGLQAARASDYSIAQFRFLQRLLMVHGRWNYRRISKLILYSFYKNITLYMTQFWFCFYNGWSGQTLYDQWSLAVYNVWFTAFPIIILAVFDRDVPAHRLLSKEQFPDLYLDGIRNRLFNTKYFLNYAMNAVLQSLICFMFSMYCLAPAMDATLGIDMGMGSAGVLTFSVVLGVVTAKICLETLSWTWLHAWFVIGSLCMWFFFCFIYGAVFGTYRGQAFAIWYDVPHQVMSTGVCWLVIVVVVTACLARDFVFKAYRRNFNPELSHIIQVWEGKCREDPSFRFARKDIALMYPQKLGTLSNLEPKVGLFEALSSLPATFRTGFAFSQEKGQADITKTLSRKYDPAH